MALEYLVPGGVTSALDVLDKGLVTRYTLKTEKAEGVEGGAEEELKKSVGGNFGENGKETLEAMAEIPAEREIPATPTGSASEISSIHEDEGEIEKKEKSNDPPTPKYSYFVQPEQTPRSRFSKAYPSRTYKVHPTAWFCTCPTFAFAAFGSDTKPVATNVYPTPTDRNKKVRKRWERLEYARVWKLLETHGWVWGGRSLGVHAPPVCKHLLACVLVQNCGGLFRPFVKEVEMDMEEMVGMSVNLWK